jgi:Galactose oxidase, central domain
MRPLVLALLLVLLPVQRAAAFDPSEMRAAPVAAWADSSALAPSGLYSPLVDAGEPSDPIVAALPGKNGSWYPPANGPSPSSRWGHTCIYDPIRDRMLLFGGNDDVASRGDTWVMSMSGPPVWRRLQTDGVAPTRHQHTAIYDPIRDRMIVFAGSSGSTLQRDVWALNLSGAPTWVQITTTGGVPSRRRGHTAIYDPIRDRMLAYGGYDNDYDREVWELTLGDSPRWTLLTPVGGPPVGSYGASATYDPVRDQMVVIGGDDGGTYPNGAVWALSLSSEPAWSQLAPNFTLYQRAGHVTTYFPEQDCIVAMGGYAFNSVADDDVWAFSLQTNTWQPLLLGPLARYFHSAIYDSYRSRMIVCSGNNRGARNDTWAFVFDNGGAWSLLNGLGTGAPSARSTPTAVYDSLRRRMIVFGGDEGSTRRNDTWSLDLGGNPSWVQLFPAGTAPPARAGHSAVYDSNRDRVIVFGGFGSDPSDHLNDTWALNLSPEPAWQQLIPSRLPPPAREYHSAIYDPIADRMIVFGGWNGIHLEDMWQLSFSGSSGWSQIATAVRPAARWGHTASYDPVGERMLVLGGNTASGNVNDIWALALSDVLSWGQITPVGTPPAPRRQHTAVYDLARDRILLFGGGQTNNSIFLFNDTWALTLSDMRWAQQFPEGTAPIGRRGHVAALDTEGARMVVFGGYIGPIVTGGYRNDTRMLDWSTVISVDDDYVSDAADFTDAPLPEYSAMTPHLAAIVPNPCAELASLQFEMLRSGRVRLAIFDVSGRLQCVLLDEWRDAGAYRSDWYGTGSDGRRLANGVYLARLETTTGSVTRKLTLVR